MRWEDCGCLSVIVVMEMDMAESQLDSRIRE